jgi:hypothetical protein
MVVSSREIYSRQAINTSYVISKWVASPRVHETQDIWLISSGGSLCWELMCAIGDDDNFISNSILLSGELQTIPCEVGIISGHAIKAPRNSIGPMIGN